MNRPLVLKAMSFIRSLLRATALRVLFVGSAIALTDKRFPRLAREKMTPAQRTVADSTMSGPRKGLAGSFNAWLRRSELADHLEAVDEYLRFNTSLDKRANEMAIIITAQDWGSQHELYEHAPRAKQGLISRSSKRWARDKIRI